MNGRDQPENVNCKRSFENNEGATYTAGSEHVDWDHLSHATDQLWTVVDTELFLVLKRGFGSSSSGGIREKQYKYKCIDRLAASGCILGNCNSATKRI
jgi:hypothetical protein